MISQDAIRFVNAPSDDYVRLTRKAITIDCARADRVYSWKTNAIYDYIYIGVNIHAQLVARIRTRRIRFRGLRGSCDVDFTEEGEVYFSRG